jgi:hypothetical protein
MENVRIDFEDQKQINEWADKLKVSKEELVGAYDSTGSNQVGELQKAIAGELNIYNTTDSKDLL